MKKKNINKYYLKVVISQTKKTEAYSKLQKLNLTDVNAKYQNLII